jgi:hypothetical protein
VHTAAMASRHWTVDWEEDRCSRELFICSRSASPMRLFPIVHDQPPATPT